MPSGFENPFKPVKQETQEESRERLGLGEKASAEEISRAEIKQTRGDKLWGIKAGEALNKKAKKFAEQIRKERERENKLFKAETVDYISGFLERGEVEEARMARALIEALAGIDGEQVMYLRRALGEISGVDDSFYIESLSGLGSSAARKERERLFRVNPSAVVESLIGLHDEQANALRERIKTKSDINIELRESSLLRSYAGFKDVESDNLRRQALTCFGGTKDGAIEHNLKLNGLIASLTGLSDRESMKMRSQLLDKFEEFERNKTVSPGPLSAVLQELAISLAGNDDADAWATRDRLRRFKDDGDRLYLISLTGVQSQRADKIREEVFKDILFKSPKGNINRPLMSQGESELVAMEHGENVMSLVLALRGVNNQSGKNLRRSLETNKIDPAFIAKSMYGGEIMVAVRVGQKSQ